MFLFFFKQKTAYEMRISDWSSDVCSSDLTELNIEGNSREEKFVRLVLDAQPAQVTLVPDEAGQITSNHGWDTHKHRSYLQDMCALFKGEGIRVSIFVDADPAMVEAAAETDRKSTRLNSRQSCASRMPSSA